VALGTLSPHGAFAPTDVKTEAVLLHDATIAAGRLIFDHDVPDDLRAQWNLYVDSERDFYGRAQSFFFFLDFSEDGARDEVLALETRYNTLRTQLDEYLSGQGADAAAAPEFSDPDERQAAPLFPLLSQAEDEGLDGLSKVAKKANDAAKTVGWELIAGVLIVAGGLVGLLYVARKGGVRLPGVMA